MHVPYEVPRISVAKTPLASTDTDLIIIPIARDFADDTLAGLDAAIVDDVRSALQRGEFSAKPQEIFTVFAPAQGWHASRVVFVGGGNREEILAERFRRMVISAARVAHYQRRPRIAWADVEPGALTAAARMEIVADGAVMANFDNGVHKSRDNDNSQFFITDVTVLTTERCEEAARNGLALGDAVNSARVLINEPGNFLPPRVFADKAAQFGSVAGVTAEILDEKQVEALGMGLFLGVARGSAEPPRLLVLKYTPANAPAGKTLGLVGKGITFDTGGISIKPSDGMERMKDDMAGGASVVAALRCIALQKLPIRAVAVVPMTENMPGGKAIKPGDILRGASGLTVEVNNTDAEGRLILGDALWYARQLGATHLVDVATLTGAVVVALGKITTGVWGAPQPWVDHVRSAAERAGEKVWPMPLFDEYAEQLKSEIADMLNSPGRPAGAVTAAMFLKEFAGEGPWAHLDIAGTAWAEDAKAWQPKGATGAMIRTLVEVARGGLDV
ncbi:MAG TPA: leucyl aminopeptidase [Vicinamibacterales bacterium]|nr:leucyl aminopeptidase [Vicinamibacterales bacterium]